MRASLMGAAAILLSMVFVACSQSAPSSSSSTPPSASPTPAAAPPQEASTAEGGGEEKKDEEESNDEGGHEHTAPHGGTLVELGEEFAHVELVLDAATGTLTAYALDGEAERAVRVPQSSIDLSLLMPGGTPTNVSLAAVSNPLTGETESDTSQFRAVVPALKGATAFEGAIKAVLVRGQRFQDVAFRYPSTGHE